MKLYAKQVVHPWLCDSMGHLTTRHYMALFDDASYHLLSETSGWQPNDTSGPWRGKGWADVSQQLQYLSELHAGSLIEIYGKVLAIGNSSITFALEMREKLSGEIAATFESKTVYFDLVERKASPLSDAMREKITANRS